MRRNDAANRAEFFARLWAKPQRRMQLFALVFGVSVVVAVSATLIFSGDITSLGYWRALGYPGIFILSFLGSVALVIPVPGLIAVCGAGSIDLNLISVGLLAGAAETVGELSGYAIGYGGHTVFERRSFYTKVRGWMERRGLLVLFVASIIPNPVFDVVGIMAGGLRFPLLRFLGAVWVGKTLKGLIVVHTCSWIVQHLPFVG